MSILQAAPGLNHSPLFYWVNKWPGFFKLYFGTFFHGGRKESWDDWEPQHLWAVRVHINYLKRMGEWPRMWLNVGWRYKAIYHQFEGFSHDTNKEKK